MIQRGDKKAAAGIVKKIEPIRLHSIAGLLKERSFVGSFEAGGSRFGFTYLPVKASISGQKLILQGRFTVTDARGTPRVRDRVQALLAAAQGGLGGAPVRPQLSARVGAPREPASTSRSGLPITESTDSLSFTGAMYFILEPLEGRAFGVNIDLTRVQLNARLAPTDSTARSLHGVYSAIVEALHGEKADHNTAQAYVSELNRLLTT
jgi:hypothetical protein